MNHRQHLLTLALSVTSITASGQPPDVVVSDSQGNTAMGTDTLHFTGPGPASGNTGAGYQVLYSNTTGCNNSALGWRALFSNGNGCANTAVGASSLIANTDGGDNTAMGAGALRANKASFNEAYGSLALQSNTTGTGNSAIGYSSQLVNTTGNDNVSHGSYTLESNTTGSENTAIGWSSMDSNTTGNQNTAIGVDSLAGSNTGNQNVAVGASALRINTSGSSNTATGHHALQANTTGYHHTALGAQALFSNTTGANNTALGLGALYSNTTGSNNIAVGLNAGYNVTVGHDDIDIGNSGVAGESSTIRIGGTAQSATYIAGITTAHVTGSPVYISSTGQLGVLASSEKYKTAITGMGERSSEVHHLRPVTFHLKNDPQGALQYGLIAEEVNEVDPNLVIRDQAGSIEGVRYDELAPLLLNEVQQLQKKLIRQERKMRALEQRLQAMSGGR